MGTIDDAAPVGADVTLSVSSGWREVADIVSTKIKLAVMICKQASEWVGLGFAIKVLDKFEKCCRSKKGRKFLDRKKN